MFILGGCEHTVGDRKCVECWANYPKKCVCQGLIHAQFVKEAWEGLNLVFSCDNCGDQYKEPAPKEPQGRYRRKPKWKRTR
jgi:hypothetical protein